MFPRPTHSRAFARGGAPEHLDSIRRLGHAHEGYRAVDLVLVQVVKALVSRRVRPLLNLALEMAQLLLVVHEIGARRVRDCEQIERVAERVHAMLEHESFLGRDVTRMLARRLSRQPLVQRALHELAHLVGTLAIIGQSDVDALELGRELLERSRHPRRVRRVELQLGVLLRVLYESIVDEQPSLLRHLDRGQLEAARLELPEGPVEREHLRWVGRVPEPPLEQRVAQRRPGQPDGHLDRANAHLGR